jgi:hypothetical protein
MELGMARHDAFALSNSPVNTFLFSEVGTELNGSSLTVLSVLARLGNDPWAQALSWASQPKAVIVDRLAECIAKMPLCAQALFDARSTASRLALLLPTEDASPLLPASGWGIGPVRWKWLLPALFYTVLAMGLVANMMVMPAHDGSAVSPAAQTAVPQAAPIVGTTR